MSQLHDSHRAERIGADHPPRVVLEAPDGLEGAALWRLLKEQGYEVSWCPGPEGPPAVWCPVMSGRRCDFIDAADVVLWALGFDDPVCCEVLEKLRSVHADASVVVLASSDDVAERADLLEGHRVLRTPFSTSELIDALESARSPHVAPRRSTFSADHR